MAKTQLLAQNDNTAIDFLKQSVGHSMIDLSHTVMYPVDVDGAITPCCIVETVPTDRFEISNEILARQLQPLKVPQMTRYTLNTAYFYCSNRLAWKKWSMFLDQANKGRSDVNYSFVLPTMLNCNLKLNSDSSWHSNLVDIGSSTGKTADNESNFQGYKQSLTNCLHTYFNISKNITISTSSSGVYNSWSSNEELPLAFPFFDYQIICRDFYTNIDRLADSNFQDWDNFENPLSDWAFKNLYPVDDDEIKLIDGPQIKSGFRSGDDESTAIKGFVLDKIRYHDVRDDYFTSSKRAPMRGEAPTVDTTIAVTSVNASDVVQSFINDDATIAYDGVFTPSTTTITGQRIEVIQDHAIPSRFGLGAGTPASNASGNGISNIRDSTARLKTALERLKVNLSTTKAINAAELRLLSQLTVWQELNMLHKPTYNDFLNAHYNNVKVGDSLVEAPQYIGGTSQVIQINEVLQTSESTDSSKLGTQAAVAHSLSNNNVGSFFCPDYGYIIGVMYILPDLMYKPSLPRWATRRTVEDYYFPEFANLSMQATLNKELFFSNDSEWNNQALGYVGAYDEMRTIPNYVAGLMCDDTQTDLQRWALLRKFENSNKPAINQNFLCAKGNIDKSAWSAPNAPKFMFQIANYIKAIRPMPYIAIPKAL